MKNYLFPVIVMIAFLQLHCRKIVSCNHDIYSANRINKRTVTNVQGIMGTFTNNTQSRWMINVFEMTGGPPITCIICGNFPDSLKVVSKPVVFSGVLRDACGIVDASDVNRYYIVTPTDIR